MFARAVYLSVLALPLLVAAVALPGGGGPPPPPPPPPPSCAANTGSLNCCNNLTTVTMSIDRNKASLLINLTG